MIELHREAWRMKFSTDEAREVCMQIVGVVSDWCLIISPWNAVSLWGFCYTLLLEILLCLENYCIYRQIRWRVSSYTRRCVGLLWTLPQTHVTVGSNWELSHSVGNYKSQRLVFQASKLVLRCYKKPKWRLSFSLSDQISPPNHVNQNSRNGVCISITCFYGDSIHDNNDHFCAIQEEGERRGRKRKMYKLLHQCCAGTTKFNTSWV